MPLAGAVLGLTAILLGFWSGADPATVSSDAVFSLGAAGSTVSSEPLDSDDDDSLFSSSSSDALLSVDEFDSSDSELLEALLKSERGISVFKGSVKKEAFLEYSNHF